MVTVQEKLNNTAASAANQIVADARATEGEHGFVSESAEAFLVNLEASMFENGYTEGEVNEMLLYVLRGIANRLTDDDWKGW